VIELLDNLVFLCTHLHGVVRLTRRPYLNAALSTQQVLYRYLNSICMNATLWRFGIILSALDDHNVQTGTAATEAVVIQ